LSRTCRFMLTEEAHHMFVGETGVARVIQRTAEAMQAAGIDDPYDIQRIRTLGVIDLPTIQKKANLHFSLTLDLFGNEISTNAANAFNAGLKGRYREDKLEDDHRLTSSVYPVLRPRDGAIIREEVPALSALNMRLRDDYVEDATTGVTRWNRALDRVGTAFHITLPHVAFNRRIGEFSAIHTDVEGNILSSEDWHARRETMLPSTEDNLFISSLMRTSREPGTYAGWIAPPRHGIDNMPGDFQYVHIEG
jgi:benzoyl-CoA 2,3-dioxygenase component B